MRNDERKPIIHGLVILGLLLLLLAGQAALGHAEPAPPAPTSTPVTPPPSGLDATGRPTPEKIDELTRRTALPDLSRAARARREAWTLQGPFPGTFGVVPRTGALEPEEEPLRTSVAFRSGLLLLTESMRCVVRETGRFLLARQQRPDQELADFINGVCGETEPGVVVGWLSWDAVGATSREELWPQIATGVVEAVDELLGTGSQVAGAWFGQAGDRAIWVLAHAQRTTFIEPQRTVPEAGPFVDLSGQILSPAEQITARVTRGPLGAVSCSPSEEPLPRFRVRCPVAPEDPSARIELSVRRAGRFLGERVAEILVWPGNAPSPEFTPATLVESQPVTQPERLAPALLEAINRLRQSLSLPPLVLAVEQSELVRRLVPPYLEAVFGDGPKEQADLIALILLQGSRIPEPVIDSGFGSIHAWGTLDVGLILSAALRSPGLRQQLFEPQATILALGGHLQQEPEFLYALLSTHQVASTEVVERSATSFWDRLVAERAQQRVSAPSRRAEVEPLLDSLLAQVQAGQLPLREAMQQAGALIRDRTRRSVTTYAFQLSDPTRLELPPELLTRPELELAFSLAVLRDPDQDRARFVALVVALEPRRSSI